LKTTIYLEDFSICGKCFKTDQIFGPNLVWATWADKRLLSILFLFLLLLRSYICKNVLFPTVYCL